MIGQTVKVMKHSGVKVGGSARIAPLTGAAPVRTKAAPRASSPTAGAPQEARIIESNADYAIIEITCACGTKSYIQCNYADSQATQ